MKKLISIVVAILIGILSFTSAPSGKVKVTPTPTIVTKTLTPSITATPRVTGTSTVTSTPRVVTITPTVGGPSVPYPNAPECPTPDNYTFHTLWDSQRGCHYTHEHGDNPFTSDVRRAFPEFDLYSLLGNIEVGNPNPSSSMENTHKHGGFKWTVQLNHPQGCIGAEGAPIGVDASVIEIHGFGDYSIEFESSFHSIVAMLRQCVPSNPSDHGYIFTTQFVKYGQIVSPYQGDVMPYPYYSVPLYDSARGPYLTIGCIGQKTSAQRGACRDSLAQAKANKSESIWSSKPTGSGARPINSSLIQVLWRVRDTYQLLDWRDQTYPYTFLWLCSADGSVFNPVGCRHNNTTVQVHEVQGTIPARWDNMDGFDTDPRIGRITADGYVTDYGDLNPACTAVGTNCHPIKLIQAFVGPYGSILVFTPGKGTNTLPYLPERDIYFCGTTVCNESVPGAQPSGWVGQEN